MDKRLEELKATLLKANRKLFLMGEVQNHRNKGETAKNEKFEQIIKETARITELKIGVMIDATPIRCAMYQYNDTFGTFDSVWNAGGMPEFMDYAHMIRAIENEEFIIASVA